MTTISEKRLNYQRQRYAIRRRKGLCLLCWSKAEKGRTRCSKCSWRQRLYKLKWAGLSVGELAKARQAVENFRGICTACGRKNQCGPWCLDHNHQTKKFRGIIGHNCNVVLGMVNDRIRILKRLEKYLCGIR